MRTHLALPAILAATLLMVIATPSNIADANPSGIFQSLNGTWRGTGRIKLTGGNTQRIACRAYYNVKDHGAGLGLAIRCASADNKIELRARLNDENGKLSGTWEERTFNATGNISGRAKSGSVRMTIDGAISGSMNISYSQRRQTVSISTATEGLKGISINLRR